MTLQQFILIICVYLIVLIAVIYFTKPTLRRTGGALIGGAVGGGLFLILFDIGRVYGFWRASLPSKQGMLILFYIGIAISLTPIYLVTWRVSRRFGYRGLAVFLGVVALIAPPRDYLIASKHPGWLAFAPGVAPIFADAATYVGIVLFGHAVMRFVAGSSRKDRLAKRLFNII